MGSKYTLVLSTQLFIVLIDIMFNIISIFQHRNQTILLMCYILQDTILVIASLVLFVSFTTTFIFQIGLIFMIIYTFLPVVIITALYTIISMAYHYTSLAASWEIDNTNVFDSSFMIGFYVFHKIFACFYYSSYKRAALHIADPKYNGDSEWLREKFQSYFNINAILGE